MTAYSSVPSHAVAPSAVAGWVRRALIRNDEALVELLAPLAAEAAFGDERDFEDARAIAGRLSAIGRRLQLRRAATTQRSEDRSQMTAPLTIS